MNDERLKRLYQRGMEAREARGAAAGAPCDVPPEELLALARGELPEERRLELLDVVMRSERCRSEFELLRAVVVAGRELGGADGEVDPEEDGPDVIPFDPAERARRRERSGTRPWWRRTSIPVALAATALVAVGLSRIAGDSTAPPDVMRGAADGVVVVSPGEQVAPGARPVFAWRAVPGAARYRFELLDTGGNLLHEAVTTDTSVVLPADVALATDTEHRWIVRATDALGAELGSAVSALRVR